MTTIIENVLDEIDIIIEEQIRIANCNAVLEDRRIRLLEFIRTSQELEISKRARENLIVTVSNMEIKVVQQIECKYQNQTTRRCRHNNAGFCKMGGECVYYHTDKICDKFLSDGKCSEPKLCWLRHPKECKFWLGDRQGCLRGQECMYLHKIENKGRNIKESNLKHDSNEIEPNDGVSKTIHHKNSKNSGNNENKQNVEESNAAENVAENAAMDMEVTKPLKDVTNQEIKLENENKLMKGQLEKLKKVLANMNKELTQLKAKQE